MNDFHSRVTGRAMVQVRAVTVAEILKVLPVGLIAGDSEDKRILDFLGAYRQAFSENESKQKIFMKNDFFFLKN